MDILDSQEVHARWDDRTGSGYVGSVEGARFARRGATRLHLRKKQCRLDHKGESGKLRTELVPPSGKILPPESYGVRLS